MDILNVNGTDSGILSSGKPFNAMCWVAARTGLANGDLTGIKVLVGPELPKPRVPPEPPPAAEPCNPLIKVCP